MTRILITGACGFIGGSLLQHLQSQGYDVAGIDVRAASLVRQCDVSDAEQFRKHLDALQPDIIVHCAARKNLPDCEDNKVAAFCSNTLSTEILAQFSKETNAKIVYLSSDVVFDGVDGHYQPDDLSQPINWYGKLKAFSEVILRTVPNVAVCRTALVIGHMNNTYRHLLSEELQNEVLINQTLLPQYIYHRLQQSMPVRLPETIISNATPVNLLCDMITRIIETDATGIFHATGPDALSRYETAELIADTFGLDKALISKDDGNISPLRPRNISMNAQQAFERLDIDIEKWRLAAYLADKSLYEL